MNASVGQRFGRRPALDRIERAIGVLEGPPPSNDLAIGAGVVVSVIQSVGHWSAVQRTSQWSAIRHIPQKGVFPGWSRESDPSHVLDQTLRGHALAAAIVNWWLRFGRPLTVAARLPPSKVRNTSKNASSIVVVASQLEYNEDGDVPADAGGANGLSKYVKGFAPPANEHPLKNSEWGADKDQLTDPRSAAALSKIVTELSQRMALTYAGGLAAGYRNAAALFKHFMGNTGTPYTIDFERMNKENRRAYDNMVRELNDAIAAAESLGANLTVAQQLRIVTPRESGQPSIFDGSDWEYAISRYRTWARGTVTSGGDGGFLLEWEYNLRDNYEFGMTGLPAGLVTDNEMVQMNRWGLARHFEVTGTHKIVIAFTKGQRVGAGIKLDTPPPAKPKPDRRR